MQRLLIVFAILFVSVSNSWAWPAGYNMIDSRPGFKTYVSKDGNILVVEAETGKSIIKMGVGEEGSSIFRNNRVYRTFRRISIKNHYRYNDDGKLYMSINSQFFSWNTYAILSFNVKKDNDLLLPYIEESEKGKRLYAILSNGLPFFYRGKKSDSEGAVQYQILQLLKKKINGRDVIVEGVTGLDPFDIDTQVKVGASRYKGRNMLGCIPYKKYDKKVLGICKKTVFMIAKKSTHYNMIKELKKWGVSEDYMLTLDGSGSAQAYSEEVLYKNRFLYFPGDYRLIPSSILLYTKGLRPSILLG